MSVLLQFFNMNLFSKTTDCIYKFSLEHYEVDPSFGSKGEIGKGGQGKIMVYKRKQDAPIPTDAKQEPAYITVKTFTRHDAYKYVRRECEAVKMFLKQEKKKGEPWSPNIVVFLGTAKVGKKMAVVMELCQSTLKDFIALNRNLTVPESAAILLQICNGVSFIHSKNFIHRDIKPGNILLNLRSESNTEAKVPDASWRAANVFKSDEFVAKICDMGLSRELAKVMTGKIGSGYYRAPEIMMKPDCRYCSKVDVYALGVILLELILGGFLKGNEVPYKVADNSDIDHHAKKLLNSMLCNDPKDRIDLTKAIKELKDLATMDRDVEANWNELDGMPSISAPLTQAT